MGHITEEKLVVNGTTVLDENGITWRPDSTQSSYTANRTGGITETLAYGYDDSAGGRGHLLSESFSPSSGATA